MAADPSIVLLGEDLRQGTRGASQGLYAAFPSSVFDTPISEAAITGFASGAAMAGMRPVVEFQVPTLVYVAMDQLVNQAAKLRLMSGGQTQIPVTYIVMGSGGRGNTAGQHSDSPYAPLIHGGIKTVVPSTPHDMKGLTITAIRDNDPVAVFVPAGAMGSRGDVPVETYAIPLGQGEVKRIGDDVTVIAVGHLVAEALKLGRELESEGIDLHVWDPRSLLPLDREGLLTAVRKTGRVVIFDDSNRTCGFAAEVAAVIADNAFDALRGPIKRVTRGDIPIPFSVPLETAAMASPIRLREAVLDLTARTGRISATGS
jgi:pyruvate dehydrogenase E1 component beta subunit